MAKIFRANEGLQAQVVRSNVDFMILVGGSGTGKSTALILNIAEYFKNPLFRATVFRRNMEALTAAGSLVDDIQSIFPLESDKVKCKRPIGRVATSPKPEISFNSGARIVFNHINDETPKKVQERFRGMQSDVTIFDELTTFQFTTVSYLFSRTRGKSGVKPRIIAATNPQKTSWVRKFIDWYIDEDGTINIEKNGAVRYFFVNGNDVDDVIWGKTREEVYRLAKMKLDHLAKSASNKRITVDPLSLIKSFALYELKITDNQKFIEANPDYLSSLANSGQADVTLGSNWNIEDVTMQQEAVTIGSILRMFKRYIPSESGRKYITVDIANGGDDNLVALVWDEFTVIDVMIIQTSKALANAGHIVRLMQRWDVPASRVIYDTINAEFISDQIRGTVPFRGNSAAMGVARTSYNHIKTQCAAALVRLIEEDRIHIKEELALKQYQHKMIKCDYTLKEELCEEFGVLRFLTNDRTGKTELIKKEKMGHLLKGRSPDLLDNFIMRMYVSLHEIYDDETINTQSVNMYEYGLEDSWNDSNNIFNYI